MSLPRPESQTGWPGWRACQAAGKLTGRHHLAFQARDRDMVDAFYHAALTHGGRDNGAPGERHYHPGYYAAFVLDPQGNNIEAGAGRGFKETAG
ncbi:VOC family protein, partial [Klebsiella pneumoniae]|uniref:VOC family protein n=1 Tax=Klebsiella pneumoniae TaxID=573 RepID=UPI002108636F